MSEGEPAPRVVVTHPSRQHSHQLALALHDCGALAGYWSGVPAGAGSGRSARWISKRWSRYPPVGLPNNLLQSAPWLPGLRRLLRGLSSSASLDFVACRLFDRWAVRRLKHVGADAVVACEISALATFRAAKRRGMTVILDASSWHRTAQDCALERVSSGRGHSAVARVKDAEVELADHVLTTSPMARETYVAAGVPGDRVHALPLGVDLGTFRPANAPPAPRPFVFAFVGHFSQVKGFDLLMEATAGLVAERDFEIRAIGSGDDRLLDVARGRVKVLGALPPKDVARELALAHCLILPSRLDSFGMVVPEALACGVPVIVSSNVGAKHLIEPDRNGWIVPVGDVPALRSRMSWCIAHPEQLAAMRDDCVAAAARASWTNYRASVRTLLPRLIPTLKPALRPN